MIRKDNKKKANKIVNKIVVGLVISLLITLPATAISITMKTNSSNTFGGPPFLILGDTIIVDDDGTGDYTSIQDAINNSAPGDYIIVKDGTYGDQLTVNVGSIMISAASGESPTIYLSSYDVGIDVTAPDVTLEGFEIFGNGSLTGGPFPTIRANTGANGLNINNNHFKVFTGELGQIALMINSGVIDVTFTSNIITDYENSLYHAAHIIRTDTYYGSIQDAIDLAIAGDVINVAAGTYNERLAIDTPLTLQAASSPTIDGQGMFGPAVNIQADDVTLQGFIIKNFMATSTAYIGAILVEGNNTVINNNVIQYIYNATIDPAGIGIDVHAQNVQLMNNKVHDVGSIGIRVRDNWVAPSGVNNNVLIENNIVYRTNNTGILITGYAKDVIIRNNDINDSLGPTPYNVFVHYGSSNVIIEDNYIHDTYSNIVLAGCDNITISKNTITNATTWHSPGKNIYILSDYAPWIDVNLLSTNVSITNNDILNGSYGVRIVNAGAANATAMVSTTTINYNSISNNTVYGVENMIGAPVVDATDNWWGDISGPYHPTDNPTGMGVNVSDNVTFWPWYEFDGYSIFPTVTYTVGQPNAFFGEIITDDTQIEITAEDNESGLLSLEYRVWDASSRWSEWQEYTGKFRLSGDGQKLVEYNATDNAGTQFIGYEAHRVDTTPPYVEVIYPNGGEFLRNNVEIQWEAADKIPDQEQTVWNGYWSLTEEYPGHIQSFQPTESSLNSIGLLLVGEDADVSVKIYSNITPVPIQIAQSTQHLQYIGNENNPVWIDFPLDTELTLDTDITYYIGVTQEIHGNEGLYWYYFDSAIEPDPYLYGNAWLMQTDQLEEHLDWDFGFRTMYWEEDVEITVQYSPTGISPWSTLAEQENNDGSYIWDTSGYPEGGNYRVRIIAEDDINTLGADFSDNTFQIDNTGPIVSNVVITDTTLENTEYTKDGDSLEITATVEGNPVEIIADLSGFGKGSAVPPTSFVGTTASWLVDTILCTPSDGEIEVIIQAEDPTGDISRNTGSIIADNTPPSIEITRPGPGVYIMDSMRLLPFSFPLIIGQITFRAEATDSGSGVNQVDFVIDGSPRANISEVPYEFLWDEAAFGFFTIEVVATDNVGHTETDIMRDFFIINFDILGH